MRFATTIFQYPHPLAEIIKWLVDAGFDAVDIPADPEKITPQVVEGALAPCREKIQIGETTGCWNHTRDLINPERVKREEALSYARFCVDLAADIGSNLTHLCFMTTPEILEKSELEELQGHAIQSTREMLSYAGQKGVKLLIEPLFKGDNTIVNRAEQAVQLLCNVQECDVSDLDSGKTGLLLDAYHMHFEEREPIPRVIERYADIIGHVHLAAHTRNLDFDDGASGYVGETLAALKSVGYGGLCSFEPIPADFPVPEGLAAGLKSIRKIAASPG